MRRSLPLFVSAIAMMATLVACGGGADSGDAADAASAYPDGAIVIQPVGNEMRYAQTEFTVEAGQEVTVVFENTATSPAMQHNVLILNTDSDEDAERVGIAGMTAGAEAEYVPDDPAVFAYTPMSLPGQTVQVTFTAPTEPGRYRYICTFPGHYSLMQGVMIVT
ncbi:MAG: plastocyanin/azurin family copper-binding protein [Bacteroidota bacterium]